LLFYLLHSLLLHFCSISWDSAVNGRSLPIAALPLVSLPAMKAVHFSFWLIQQD